MNYPYYQPSQTAGVSPYYRLPQQQFMADQVQPQLKGRPVSSIEEVRAVSIDFDGSVFYFPDLANKRIYTKQINLDGTSLLNVYELKVLPPDPVISPSQYVTREEFETTLSQLKELLQTQPMQIKEEPKVVKQPQSASNSTSKDLPKF